MGNNCVLDNGRDYDYSVGDSLLTVFGIGSMLMTSSGVEVLVHVTVPQSLLPTRLLKVFFLGVPEPQICSVCNDRCRYKLQPKLVVSTIITN